MKQIFTYTFLVVSLFFSQTSFAQDCDTSFPVDGAFTRYVVSDALDDDGLALILPAEQGVYLPNYSESGHATSLSFDTQTAYLDIYENNALLHGNVEMISDDGGPFEDSVGTVWTVCIVWSLDTSTPGSLLLELEADPTTPVYQTSTYTDFWDYYTVDSTYSSLSYVANDGSTTEFHVSPVAVDGIPFQLGDRANGKNLNFGMMGYFSFASAQDGSEQVGNLNIDLADFVPLPDEDEEVVDDEGDDEPVVDDSDPVQNEDDDDTTSEQTQDDTTNDTGSTVDGSESDDVVTEVDAALNPFANAIFQGSGNNCSLNPQITTSDASFWMFLVVFGALGAVSLKKRAYHKS